MTISAKPINLTVETFQDEVLNSATPVLVDIWAPWCGPCRVIGPVVEELARDFDGRVKVTKLNNDENEAIAAQYSIQAIPTLLLFNNGQVLDRIVGLVSKAKLTDTLNQLLDTNTVVNQN